MQRDNWESLGENELKKESENAVGNFMQLTNLNLSFPRYKIGYGGSKKKNSLLEKGLISFSLLRIKNLVSSGNNFFTQIRHPSFTF